jgi:hypothetical protein
MVKARIPGLRQSLPERVSLYGEPVPNERSLQNSGGRGLLPTYQGPAQYEGDAITGQLEKGSIGMPTAPKEMSIDGGKVPLTINEQRRFQELWGREYRKLLEDVGAGTKTLTDSDLEYLRAEARAEAAAYMANELGETELDRRWYESPDTEIEP